MAITLSQFSKLTLLKISNSLNLLNAGVAYSTPYCSSLTEVRTWHSPGFLSLYTASWHPFAPLQVQNLPLHFRLPKASQFLGFQLKHHFLKEACSASAALVSYRYNFLTHSFTLKHLWLLELNWVSNYLMLVALTGSKVGAVIPSGQHQLSTHVHLKEEWRNRWKKTSFHQLGDNY